MSKCFSSYTPRKEVVGLFCVFSNTFGQNILKPNSPFSKVFLDKHSYVQKLYSPNLLDKTFQLPFFLLPHTFPIPENTNSNFSLLLPLWTQYSKSIFSLSLLFWTNQSDSKYSFFPDGKVFPIPNSIFSYCFEQNIWYPNVFPPAFLCMKL